MSTTPAAAVELDVRGQRCPAPVIALGRQTSRTPGVRVELLADDPAARYDIPAWCRLRSATLLGCRDETDGTAAWQRYTVDLPAVPAANAPGSASSAGSAAT